MTVGEKIQLYRKKEGLSQEELGAKLFVSRQTVSLWEMDKTVPTVDNLIRLKEIFGVSIDNMLSEEDECESCEEAAENEDYTESNAEKPLEEYSVHLNSTETETMNSAVLSDNWKRSVIPLFCGFILIAIGIVAKINAIAYIAATLCGVIAISCATVHIKFRSRAGKLMERVLDTVYVYKVYKDYSFTVTVKSLLKGKTVRYYRIESSEATGVTDMRDFYRVEYGGIYFPVKKEQLAEDSYFHKLFKEKNPKKSLMQGKTEKSDAWNTAGITLFVLSLFSGWIALIVAAIISRDASLGNEMWVFYVFTLIPLSSFVFAFILKKKGRKYLKNLVAGVLITSILCCFGSTYVPYEEWRAPITRAEEITGMYLPTPNDIVTVEYDSKNQPEPQKGYVHYVTYVELTREEASAFERLLTFENKWMDKLPVSMMGIKPPYPNVVLTYDYYYVYNLTEKKANTLPSYDGEYHLLAMCYDTQENKLIITEYRVEYTR